MGVRRNTDVVVPSTVLDEAEDEVVVAQHTRLALLARLDHPYLSHRRSDSLVRIKSLNNVLLSSMPIIVALCLGLWLRLRTIPTLFFGSDEMVCLFSGIRLHWLPLWNLQAQVRDNFWKSLVMSVHGLGDPLYFYVVTAVYRLMHIPFTEANLFRAGAVLGTATVYFLSRLTKRLAPEAVWPMLALAICSPALITSSTTGFQLNFILFLQVVILLTYQMHLTQAPPWRTALLMVLMALCAGTELFYLAPVLGWLHLTSVGNRWRRVDMFVWAAYGAMLTFNLWLLWRIGWRDGLTLFGHFTHNLSHITTRQAPWDFLRLCIIDSLPLWWLGVSLIGAWRERFLIGYAFMVGGMCWWMHLLSGMNLIHLWLPVALLLSVGLTRFLRESLRRCAWNPHWAGMILAFIFVCRLAPWQIQSPLKERMPPAYFHSLKAVGCFVRDRGGPQTTVYLASSSQQVRVMAEYYFGLSASASDSESQHIFAFTRPNYTLPMITKVLGHRPDFVVVFTGEQAGGTTTLDLTGWALAGIVFDDRGDIAARIYASHASFVTTDTIRHGNARFDKRYAHYPALFTQRSCGTTWYFGESLS